MSALCVWLSIGLLLMLAGVISMLQEKRNKSKPPPYRKVVSRAASDDGETVKLECGHVLHLFRMKRVSFPCEECRSK